ncbi:MAG: hypothetical protein NZ581_09270, partial [Candidatus Caldarchaeum sp.]|nr:hypothetical protein [Candidatus Caldarchaeum sp.]MDW8436362.1 hypothetical protein [Candidatus Caldarchaeum sp.]
MAEPSTKTGALFLLGGAVLSAAGFLLGLGVETGSPVFPAGWFLQLLTLLQFDVGPAVMAFGIGWIVSGLHPLRKWYLYSVTAGLIVSTISFAASTYLPITQSYLVTAILLSLTWAVGPSLITAGVFAAIVVNRHAAKHGFKVSPNPHENSLDVVVLTALYIPLLPLAATEVFYIRYILPALAAWVFWHLLADRLTTYLLEKQVRNKQNVQLVA